MGVCVFARILLFHKHPNPSVPPCIVELDFQGNCCQGNKTLISFTVTAHKCSLIGKVALGHSYIYSDAL